MMNIEHKFIQFNLLNFWNFDILMTPIKAYNLFNTVNNTYFAQWDPHKTPPKKQINFSQLLNSRLGKEENKQERAN